MSKIYFKAIEVSEEFKNSMTEEEFQNWLKEQFKEPDWSIRVNQRYEELNNRYKNVVDVQPTENLVVSCTEQLQKEKENENEIQRQNDELLRQNAEYITQGDKLLHKGDCHAHLGILDLEPFEKLAFYVEAKKWYQKAEAYQKLEICKAKIQAEKEYLIKRAEKYYSSAWSSYKSNFYSGARTSADCSKLFYKELNKILETNIFDEEIEDCDDLLDYISQGEIEKEKMSDCKSAYYKAVDLYNDAVCTVKYFNESISTYNNAIEKMDKAMEYFEIASDYYVVKEYMADCGRYIDMWEDEIKELQKEL